MSGHADKDVLVVEDDEGIRNLIHTILTRVGLSCDLAEDGIYAIEHLSTCRYHIVLLDLMLPRLDGAGVLRKLISQYPESDRPLVMVMTASTDYEKLLGATEAVQVVIRKPFDVHYLGRLVRDCVVQRHATENGNQQSST